jgi:hypothetical protein
MLAQIRSSKLRAESLESRQMMAGDVDAFAVGRFLYITGDESSNGIAIVDDGSGNLNVVGIDQAGSATTVNGGANQTFSKIKDIVISMGKGDDAVAISDLYINGNLYVSGGKGDDAIGLGDFVDTGVFDDAVDSLLGTLTVKKSVVLSGDDGDDTVLAEDAAISKSLVISTSIGEDTVALTGGVTAKTATISTATGNDTVTLAQLSVSKSLVVSTANDDDTVTLDQVSTKSLVVSLDAGDDTVTVEDSSATKTAVFNGGSDTNSYTGVGVNTFNKLIRKNFATIV